MIGDSDPNGKGPPTATDPLAAGMVGGLALGLAGTIKPDLEGPDLGKDGDMIITQLAIRPEFCISDEGADGEGTSDVAWALLDCAKTKWMSSTAPQLWLRVRLDMDYAINAARSLGFKAVAMHMHGLIDMKVERVEEMEG
jgi:hypothetical protein